MYKEDLIIIRHARSEHNIGNDKKNLDSDLSEWGYEQANHLAQFLKDQTNTSEFPVFVSPYLRCLNTAKFISDVNGNSVTVCDGLCEYLNHSGSFCFVPKRSGEFPDYDWSKYYGVTYRDEFNEHFMNRIFDVFHNLPSKSIVVTHGLPAIALLSVAQGNKYMPVWDHSISNASVSYIKKGRVIWHGRTLYWEHQYDKSLYHTDFTIKKE